MSDCITSNQLSLPLVVEIPLSKFGDKYRGKYSAVVSIEDSDLEQYDWQVHESGGRIYARREIREQGKKKYVYLHRVIAERVQGEIEWQSGTIPDHIDNNSLNNQRNNIRVISQSKNILNAKRQSRNQSGCKGVTWHKRDKIWYVQAKVNGKSVHVGMFKIKEEAIQAYHDYVSQLPDFEYRRRE